jgi:hypothetical protein
MKIDLGDKAADYLQLSSLVTYLVFAQDEVKAWAYNRSPLLAMTRHRLGRP